MDLEHVNSALAEFRDHHKQLHLVRTLLLFNHPHVRNTYRHPTSQHPTPTSTLGTCHPPYPSTSAAVCDPCSVLSHVADLEQMVDFSEREKELMALAWQCFEEEPKARHTSVAGDIQSR